MRGVNLKSKSSIIVTVVSTLVLLLVLANILPLAEKKSSAANSFQAGYNSGSTNADFSIGSNVASTDTALPTLNPAGYGGTNSLSYSYDGTSTLKYPTASNLPADKGSIEMKFQKSAYGNAVDQDKGSMNRPGGIAYDAATGNIYVADSQNHRIIRTKIDGTGWSTLGSYGTGTGQFNVPTGIRFSGDYLYVADTNNNRVVKTKFDGGGWQAKSGFSVPRDLDYDDSTGDVYVANTGAGNVIKIRFGTLNWETASVGGPVGIHYENETGFLYIALAENLLRKVKFDGTGTVNLNMPWRAYGWGGSILSYGLYSDPATGYVYSTYHQNGGGGSIAKLKMDGSEFIENVGFDCSAASVYDPASQMFYVAHANQYGSETSPSYISKSQIDRTGWTTYGSYYSNLLKGINRPGHVFVDTSSKVIYVADVANNRIVRTRMDGSGYAAWGSTGSGVGQFRFRDGYGWSNVSSSVIYDNQTDYFYISDFNNNRIVKTKWGGEGWTSYAISGTPTYITLNQSTGYIFYSNNNQFFRIKTDLVTDYFAYSSSVGQPSTYYDNANNWIYYTGTGSVVCRVHFDGTGNECFGSDGSGPSQFSGWYKALHFDPVTGYIYICDANNNRVVKTQWNGVNWSTLGGFSVPLGVFYDASTEYLYINNLNTATIIKTKIDGTGWVTTSSYSAKEKILYSAQSTDDSRLVYDVASRKLRFYLAYSNKAQFVETPTLSLTDGSWYTVKASFNKAAHTLSIDLNGVNQATNTYDTDWGSLSYGTSFYIGARNGSTTDRWDGMIDDININIESVDTTLPTNPTTANTHIYSDNTKATVFTSDNWGNSATPYITWSGATDAGSGLKGYYAYFGTDATAEPNSTSGLLTPNDGAKYFKTHVGADGAEQNVTVPANVLTTGVTYYLILRTQDNDLNTTDKTTLFTYKHDGGAPAPPEFINASPAGCSTSSTFTFTWDTITDPVSGIAGYEYKNGSNGTIQQIANVGTLEKAPYQEGDNIIYIRAKDNAGNVSSWQTAVYCSTGIAYIIDGPTVVAGPSSITVNWISNKPTTSSVKVYDGNTYISEQGQTSYDINHAVKVIGLKPEKTYRYKLAWSDQTGNIAESEWYETATTIAPKVIDLKAEVLTPSRAAISWKTDVAASFAVEYGIANYDSKVSLDGKNTAFSIFLDNLSGGSLYQLNVKGSVDDGTDFLSGITFSTPPIPIISNLRFEPITDQSSAGVKVTWTTNVDTTSSVFVGPSSGALTEKSLSAPVRDHSISILDLQDNTNYSIYATGTDQYGNSAKSDTSTFKTSLDSRPPKITDLAIEATSAGSGTDAKAQIAVSFKTDESATAQVEYGEGSSSESYSSKTQEDTSYSTNHVVIIGNLDPSKIYHLRAVSRDRAGNTTNSEDNAVITKKPTESAFNLILQSLSKAFGWLKIFN